MESTQAGEELALALLLREPANFGRSTIMDQIVLRRVRIGRSTDPALAAEIEDEVQRLMAAVETLPRVQ
jgi:hypothetical protein